MSAAYAEARGRIAASALPLPVKEAAIRQAVSDLTLTGKVDRAADAMGPAHAADFGRTEDGAPPDVGMSEPVSRSMYMEPQTSPYRAVSPTGDRHQQMTRIDQDIASAQAKLKVLTDAGVIHADDAGVAEAAKVTTDAEGLDKAYKAAAACLTRGGMV